MFCEPYPDVSYLVYSPSAPHLLYYSHFPAIIVAVLLSAFIIYNNKDLLAARILAAITVIFTAWTIVDLFLWIVTDSRVIMFLWSYWFLFITLLSVLSFYFLYTFTTKRDLNIWHKALLILPIIPTVLISGSSLALSSFDVLGCNAIENKYMLTYSYIVAGIFIVATLILAIRQIIRAAKENRGMTMVASFGILFFLVSFSSATLVASIENFLVSSPDTFAIEQYGYFGMTIFIAFLTYTIVKYKAFNVKLIATQALVAALVILIGSQFFFIRNPISKILNGITFAIAIGFGYLLIRTVQREIEQRKQVEKLANELGKANQQQVILIHFITHQIKGFVAKSRNIFASLREGDYGKLPEAMVPMVEEGFRSDTKGAQTIQEILNAANIKSGKVEYIMQPFDLKGMIDEILKDLRVLAEGKGLTLNATLAPITFTGDRGQLINAFKNLIDNSIKYTPKGTVDVSLAQAGNKIIFEIKDTGVGIAPDDMKNLFTEGGHGKNSQKINVESTGFGLYIVKNIIEAHKGTVRAESEGEGKGSRFIIELPA